MRPADLIEDLTEGLRDGRSSGGAGDDGLLLVRGGVHQVAYARALERLTGSDMMKLFPSPRIPTDKVPECQPHIKRGEHLNLLEA